MVQVGRSYSSREWEELGRQAEAYWAAHPAPIATDAAPQIVHQQDDFQNSIQRLAAEEQRALQMAQRAQIERQFAGAPERAVQQGINRGFAGQFGMQPDLQTGRGGSYIPNLIRRGRTAFQQALASIGASDTDAGIPIDSGGPAPAAATAFASPTDFGYSGSTGSAPVETTAPPPAWGGLGVFYGGG